MHLRSRRFFANALALVLAMTACTAWCQVDLSASPQVRMEVLAVDEFGLPVQKISADTLVARGLRKPVAIRNLVTGAEPQSVCVLVEDARDSLGDGLSMVLTKSRRLLRKLPTDDEVCVASFSSKLSIAQPLTVARYTLTYMAENLARDGHEERFQISFDKAHRGMNARIQAPEGYYAPSK